MPVAVLSAAMPASEFQEWMAFYKIRREKER